MIGSGLKCLIWEVVLPALSCLAINAAVMLRYARKGLRRSDV